MPWSRTTSDEIIKAAQRRVVHDDSHLEQLALICDLFSRIEIAETRDLVASVTAYALHGTTGERTH
jgi:hypothetical protein